MRKDVIAFVNGERRGAVSVDCEGKPPSPPSTDEFQTAARRAMIDCGLLSALDATSAKFVVQD